MCNPDFLRTKADDLKKWNKLQTSSNKVPRLHTNVVATLASEQPVRFVIETLSLLSCHLISWYQINEISSKFDIWCINTLFVWVVEPTELRSSGFSEKSGCRRNKFLKQRGNAGPNIRRCISILFVLVVVLTELGSSEFSEKVKGEILKTFPSSLQTNDVATLAPEKGVRFIIEPFSVSLGATWLAVTTPWPKRKTVTKLNNRWVHCPFVVTCDSSCLESYRVEWAGWNCFEIIPNLRSEVVNRLAWLSGMCRLCSMFLTGWANTCQLCDGRLNFFVILTWMLVEAG